MIKIKVDGQSAQKLNTPVIAAGAVNFLFLQAEFSADWDGLNKSYIFTNGDICIQIESDEDKIAVPAEVLTEGEFTVGIKGVRLDELNNSVGVKATHNALTYRVQASGIDGAPQNAKSVTPDLLEQMRAMAENTAIINSLIRSGSGEGSAVMGNRENNLALSDYSIAAGDNTVAGRKAYYIKSIFPIDHTIYLTEKQVTPEFSNKDNTDIAFETPAFDAGDEFSIINGDHYTLCAKIASVKNNVITYSGELPFNSFAQSSNADAYTLSVPSKPDVGIITLGAAAFAAGQGNSAAGRSSFAAGRDNVAAGNYSAVLGQSNKAGYADFVAGYKNSIVGHYGSGFGRYNSSDGYASHIEGGYNTSQGDYSHVEGQGNKSNGSDNHVEGRYNEVNGIINTVGGSNNKVTGNINDVSGQSNIVNGYRNTVRGYCNTTTGNHQLVAGQFSKDEPDKVFIIGYGSSEENRKNVMTVDRNGNARFEGMVHADGADAARISADTGYITFLYSQLGSFDDLKTETIKITGDVDAESASFKSLNSDTVKATGEIDAESGKFKALTANTITTTGDINTKNIDAGVICANYVYARNLDNYLYTFDNYKMVSDFVDNSVSVDISCYQRSMKAVSTWKDPIIRHNFNSPINGKDYPFIKIRYKIDGEVEESNNGRIYFTTTQDSTLRSSSYSIIADNQWHDVIIDMLHTNSFWLNGNINHMRFDLPNASENGVTAYFKYIGFFHDEEEAESFEL